MARRSWSRQALPQGGSLIGGVPVWQRRACLADGYRPRGMAPRPRLVDGDRPAGGAAPMAHGRGRATAAGPAGWRTRGAPGDALSGAGDTAAPPDVGAVAGPGAGTARRRGRRRRCQRPSAVPHSRAALPRMLSLTPTPSPGLPGGGSRAQSSRGRHTARPSRRFPGSARRLTLSDRAPSMADAPGAPDTSWFGGRPGDLPQRRSRAPREQALGTGV